MKLFPASNFCWSTPFKLAGAIVVAAAIQGCAGSNLTAEAHARIKKIAVIPADSIIGYVEKEKQAYGEEITRSMVVRNEDSEGLYRRSVTGDVARLLKNRGYQVDTSLLTLVEERDPAFALEYLSFVRDYEQSARARTSLPVSGGEPSVNVLKTLTPIAKRVNADAYMVITFRKVSWETPSTGERIVAAALFGALLSDENSNIEIACIERDTGKILWKEGLSGSIEPYHLVRRALGSFPSAATQSKGN